MGTPHKNKLDKASKFAMVIKGAVSRTWGLSPKAIQWIYKAIVLPKITYAAHVWFKPNGGVSGGIAR